MGILEHEEVEQHYIETFAYKLLETYINTADDFKVTPTEETRVCVRQSTRVDPAEYVKTYYFTSSTQQEIFSDMASFTFTIYGELSEDTATDNLIIENMELNFADKFYRINCIKLNELILSNLNIV